MPANDCLAFADGFQVGEWLVEPSLDRLSRNGTVLHLRPQLTDLLVLLARNAGRTVSKEEILSEVWKGQSVAESGVTRCIAEIRQALGDDARDPTIIQTITKKGYRLIAAVTSVSVPSASPAASAALVEHSPSLPRPRSSEKVPAPAADARASQAPVPEWRPPAAPFRQRFVQAALSSLGLALLIVPAWIAAGWSRAPVVSERHTAVLADLANTTGDGAFNRTFHQVLAAGFGDASFLQILPASRVRATLTLMGRPLGQPLTGPLALDLCRRERAAVLIQGSIARLGSHYAVGLEALGCTSGEAIARELVEAENTDGVEVAVRAAASRLSRTLRSAALPVVETARGHQQRAAKDRTSRQA